MKRILLLTIFMGALSACTAELSEQDRMMLSEARDMSMSASTQAAQASQNAQAASATAQRSAQEAAMAAAAAEQASERTNRMVSYGNYK